MEHHKPADSTIDDAELARLLTEHTCLLVHHRHNLALMAQAALKSGQQGAGLKPVHFTPLRRQTLRQLPSRPAGKR